MPETRSANVALSKDTVSAIINEELQARDERLNFLESKVSYLEEKISKLESAKIVSDIVTKHLQRAADDNQQYMKRQNIFLDGLLLSKNVNDEQIKNMVLEEIDRLKLDISKKEVDRAHRSGRSYFDKEGRRKQKVIVRFTSWYARNLFYSARKQSRYYVTADLTDRRSILLQKMKARIVGSKENDLFAFAFADRN